MLNKLQKKKLDDILIELETLESSLQVDRAFLETQKSSGELAIFGNSEGMIPLAIQILSLARAALSGKHYHYDNASTLDRCDLPFTIAYRAPSWDTENGD